MTDDDSSSLGDWAPDERKLPHGLSGVADELGERDLALGLWMEPEMVSPDSDLFREYPSWAIGVPGRERSQSRHQLVLDLTRPDVVDHLFGTMSTVLSSAPIAYLKWDMNRSLTEPYSAELGPERQGEFSHRYVLGLYELYRRLTAAFPDLLIESCASGAGRFDPGLLAFAPQTWTSSSTDPVERLRIQWGASLLYPPSTLGAHVTPRRNWIVGRETPLPFRTAVAVFGVLGFELDPDALTHDERQEIARLVEWYKHRRHVLQFGRFRRLRSPYAGRGDEAAWMTIAGDGSHAIVGWYRIAATPNPPIERLRLRGLDPTAVYRVAAWPGGVDERARANLGDRTGADLMGFGLFREVERSYPDPVGDHHAAVFDLERISTSG